MSPPDPGTRPRTRAQPGPPPQPAPRPGKCESATPPVRCTKQGSTCRQRRGRLAARRLRASSPEAAAAGPRIDSVRAGLTVCWACRLPLQDFLWFVTDQVACMRKKVTPKALRLAEYYDLLEFLSRRQLPVVCSAADDNHRILALRSLALGGTDRTAGAAAHWRAPHRARDRDGHHLGRPHRAGPQRAVTLFASDGA